PYTFVNWPPEPFYHQQDFLVFTTIHNLSQPATRFTQIEYTINDGAYSVTTRHIVRSPEVIGPNINQTDFIAYPQNLTYGEFDPTYYEIFVAISELYSYYIHSCVPKIILKFFKNGCIH
ncbi:44822_t:CDS:1, partial [Gigaspora margarita]